MEIMHGDLSHYQKDDGLCPDDRQSTRKRLSLGWKRGKLDQHRMISNTPVPLLLMCE